MEKKPYRKNDSKCKKNNKKYTDDNMWDAKNILNVINDSLDPVKDKDIINNLGMINHIIYKNFAPYAEAEYENMVQVGLVSLLEARNKYNKNLGCKFSSFAYNAILCGIKNYIFGESSGYGRHTKNSQIKFFIYNKIKENSSSQNPKTLSELCDYTFNEAVRTIDTSLTKYEYVVMWNVYTNNNCSLESLCVLDEEGHTFSLASSAPTPEDIVCTQGELHDIIVELIDNERTDLVKRMYREFVSTSIRGEKFNQSDFAERNQVTKQYVSLMINKLKREVSKRYNIC